MSVSGGRPKRKRRSRGDNATGVSSPTPAADGEDTNNGTSPCFVTHVPSTRRPFNTTKIIMYRPLLQYPSRIPHERSASVILERFAISPQGELVGYGLLDFLPDLFREMAEHSCLGVSVDLFASVYSVNEQRQRPHLLYGNALRSINDSLRHPSRGQEDGTIMAVWLLGNYEVSSYHHVANSLRIMVNI